MKVKVITVLTHHMLYSNILEEQLDYLELDYKFLGFGKKWKGWEWRTKLLKDELKNIDEKEYIVCIIDGQDVLAFDDEKTILEKYNKFNKPVVLTKNTRIDNNLFNLWKKNTNRIINGGIYIGNPKIILELYNLVEENYQDNKKQNDHFDDEIQLNKFLKSKNKKYREFIEKNIEIDENNDLTINDDTYCNLFLNESNFIIYNHKLICGNKQPSFYHNNGTYRYSISNIELFTLKRIPVETLKRLSLMIIIIFIFIIFLLKSLE